jgi:enamine deaminase RidA (YjgF/YER057c/UK114 family)
MKPEDHLQKLGLELPSPPKPAGSYLPLVRVGDLIWLSGAICTRDGALTHTGFVGEDLTLEEAQEAARICALNLLAVLRGELGSLEKVRRVVQLTGYVLARDGFSESPRVINGASELLVEVFGERGRHSRAAVAVSGLPLHSSVELSAVVQVSG